MTAKKTDIRNEAEIAHAIIDRYVRNKKDREELKKSLTPVAITFLLRWEGERDLDMEERVTGIVMKKMQEIYEKDNESLCKSVTDNVCAKLDEFVKDIFNRLEKLESLENDQKKIITLLHLMNERMNKMEKRVYVIDAKRFKALEDRMLRIEKNIDQHLKDNSV
jgi:hypothetical protein